LAWTTGPGFAYKDVSARRGHFNGRRKTMAKKKATKKLKKGKKLQDTKPLTSLSIPFNEVKIEYKPQ
jgi:hypothetical protein